MQNQGTLSWSECPANPQQPSPVGPEKLLQPPRHLHSSTSSWYVEHFLSWHRLGNLPREHFQHDQSFWIRFDSNYDSSNLPAHLTYYTLYFFEDSDEDNELMKYHCVRKGAESVMLTWKNDFTSISFTNVTSWVPFPGFGVNSDTLVLLC